MPRTKRDMMKRSAGYAVTCIAKAQERVLDLSVELGPKGDDPGITEEGATLAHATKATAEHIRLLEFLDQALQMLFYADHSLRAFCTTAWGADPEMVERWTSTGEDWRKAMAQNEESEE